MGPGGPGVVRIRLPIPGDRLHLEDHRMVKRRPFTPADAQPGDPAVAAIMPPISILKPLRGADPLMYEAFRSHCLQDYPEFELIFGVADENDPAAAEVRRLQREFPTQPIKLVICPRTLGTNRKVSTLVQLMSSARHDLILVNDSDILVPPDYLRKIAAGFTNGVLPMGTSVWSRPSIAPCRVRPWPRGWRH